MMARVTPAAWKVSISRESSPSESQWTLDSGVGGGAGIHLGIGLFFERRDDDLFAVGAGGFEQQERKAAVAGDQTELFR